MASNLHLIVVVCLTSGLWTGANADGESDQVSQACPPVWTQFGDHCYIYFRGPKDWADAETACVALGGNLASIPNKAVFDFLNKMILRLQSVNSGTWIGGHDAAKEGVWMWSDGTKFDFKGWGKGEPNNFRKQENCVAINYYNVLNDEHCGVRKKYICGKKV